MNTIAPNISTNVESAREALMDAEVLLRMMVDPEYRSIDADGVAAPLLARAVLDHLNRAMEAIE